MLEKDKDKDKEADPKANEDQKFVTMDELTALLRSRDEKLLGKVTSETGKLFAKLDEVLTAREAAPPSNHETPAKQKIEESPEYKGLLKRMSETEALVKSARAEAEAERARARDSQMRQTLGEALVTAGVDPKHVKQAVGYLVDAEKRVKTTETGGIVFVDGTDEVDLQTGLRSWIKSDEAKLYQTPRGTQGSGERPGNKVTPRQPQAATPSREDLALQFQAALTSGTVNVG